MTLANSLALTLLAAVCSSSAPRLVPLALLLLADRCEAAGTVCDNSVPCSSGCRTGVYGTSLCDGTYTGTAVGLSGRGLSGTIPPQLGDISQLTYLILNSNSISGTIPPDTSKLSQLEHLNLNSNSISGTIPPDTSKLSQLEMLSLGNNPISGTIPPDTSKLSQLKTLSLYSNPISGTIPPDTSKLAQLEHLILNSNSISGTIPPETGKLSQLELLDLVSNSISGTIPPDTSKLSQLEMLSLNSNSISGTIPPETGKLSQLETLYLVSNSISGTIPPETGKLSQLETLSLSNNGISGTVPSQLNDLPLTNCWLGGTNRFACPLPTLPNVCTSGSDYPPECNYPPPSTPPSPPRPPRSPPSPPPPPPSPPSSPPTRDICGNAPAVCDGTYTGTYLDLSGRDLTGSIPVELADLDSLQTLDLRDNKLEYPRSSEARVEYDLATRICRGAGSAECLGVPPRDCSAFADAQLSVTDPNECVVCDNQTASLIIVGVCILVGIIVLAAFVRLVVRNPSALKRWVSTAAILFNHAQTASIIASMRLEWPRSLIAIASALKLDLLMLPSASCLVGVGGQGSAFTQYAFYASSAMLVLLLAPLLVKYFALYRRRLAIADTAELVLSLIYSLLFTFAWSLVLEYVAYAVGNYDGYHPAYLTVPVLGALLLVLLLRFSGNVRAFKRGVESGVWRRPNSCGGSACCGTRPIPPRRLERQVAYLVGRFARHAPRWQIVIWLRQFILLLLAFASNVLFDATTENTFNAGRYAIAAVAIAVTLVFWRLHCRALPFAFRFQNALEACLYGATALFLALAMVYTALPADPAAARVSVEALMAIVLLGSLIVGAVYSIRELRRMRRALADVDLSAILSAADSKIDGSLADRLRDGSVRLLRSSWLASPASDAFLGRDASGAVIMKRQQDMPAEAFVPCDEAVAMIERGDRSILALSYGWLTALHPDPRGTTLAAVRRFLEADAAVGDTGLFWDFCSLPQKGPNGEEKTEEEKAMFGRGLKVMGNFYASVTGTSVIQQRSIDLPPGATTGFGPGEYNPTPYEGEGGRGWCIFEQGTAMTVLAHLTAAERQAREAGKALPERFRHAQASRAKVYDIGGEAPVARECSLPPKEVLDEACRAIEKARFTGKADKVMVPQMLAEFEWIFRSMFEQALEDHATSGATLPPSASWIV